MYDCLTDRARKSIQIAKELSCDKEVRPSHLLVGVLKSGTSIIQHLLKDLNVSSGLLLHHAEQCVEESRELLKEDSLDCLVEAATNFSKHSDHNFVGREHIMLSILSSQEGKEVCEKVGLDFDSFFEQLNTLIENTSNEDPIQELFNLVTEANKKIDIQAEVKSLVEENEKLRNFVSSLKQDVSVIDANNPKEVEGFLLYLKKVIKEYEC